MASIGLPSQYHLSKPRGWGNSPASLTSKSLLGLKTAGYTGQQPFAQPTKLWAAQRGGRQTRRTEYRKMAKNSQFQANEIVGVDPIFRRLPDESALVASSGGIALDRMTAGSDEVIEFGEFDNDLIVVVLVERSLLEIALDKRGFQGSICPFL